MEKKLITINTSGPIRELPGCICGPVLTPTYISINSIYKMISGGRKIFEINPRNRKEKLLLNKENYNKDNFGIADTSDVIPKIVEDEARKEANRKLAIQLQEEKERLAKEEAARAAVIVQEEDPSVIPVHEEITEETPNDAIIPVVETTKEPTVVEGFDVHTNNHNNKKNKNRGDFRK